MNLYFLYSQNHLQKLYFVIFHCRSTAQYAFSHTKTILLKIDDANVTLFYYLWHKFTKKLQSATFVFCVNI